MKEEDEFLNVESTNRNSFGQTTTNIIEVYEKNFVLNDLEIHMYRIITSPQAQKLNNWTIEEMNESYNFRQESLKYLALVYF